MERLMREHYSVYWARDIMEARERLSEDLTSPDKAES